MKICQDIFTVKRTIRTPISWEFWTSISIIAFAFIGSLFITVPARPQVNIADLKKKVVLIERPRGGGRPAAIGTGFFITPRGHVLTAAHVILNSDEPDDRLRDRTLTVRLHDRTEHVARILSVNRMIDLALLKIKSDNPTPFLTLGSSDAVRVGDELVVMGHPTGGAEWELSSGDVERITLEERIHMRATLSPGYSGGPGVSSDGDVIGVALYRSSSAEQSFLVPINDAQTLLSGIFFNKLSETPSRTTTGSFVPSRVIEKSAYKNEFIRVVRKSFNRSSDKQKINLALTFENISKEQLRISLLQGDENKFLVDEKGERWILNERETKSYATGISTSRSSAKTLLIPEKPKTVLFVFVPTGSKSGKNFVFSANVIARNKKSGNWSSSFNFPIEVPALDLME